MHAVPPTDTAAALSHTAFLAELKGICDVAKKVLHRHVSNSISHPLAASASALSDTFATTTAGATYPEHLYDSNYHFLTSFTKIAAAAATSGSGGGGGVAASVFRSGDALSGINARDYDGIAKAPAETGDGSSLLVFYPYAGNQVHSITLVPTTTATAVAAARVAAAPGPQGPTPAGGGGAAAVRTPLYVLRQPQEPSQRHHQHRQSSRPQLSGVERRTLVEALQRLDAIVFDIQNGGGGARSGAAAAESSAMVLGQLHTQQAVLLHYLGLTLDEAESYCKAARLLFHLERERAELNFCTFDDALSQAILCVVFAMQVLLQDFPFLSASPLPPSETRMTTMHLSRVFSLCYELAEMLEKEFSCVEVAAGYYELAGLLVSVAQDRVLAVPVAGGGGGDGAGASRGDSVDSSTAAGSRRDTQSCTSRVGPDGGAAAVLHTTSSSALASSLSLLGSGKRRKAMELFGKVGGAFDRLRGSQRSDALKHPPGPIGADAAEVEVESAEELSNLSISRMDSDGEDAAIPAATMPSRPPVLLALPPEDGCATAEIHRGFFFLFCEAMTRSAIACALGGDYARALLLAVDVGQQIDLAVEERQPFTGGAPLPPHSRRRLKQTDRPQPTATTAEMDGTAGGRGATAGPVNVGQRTADAGAGDSTTAHVDPSESNATTPADEVRSAAAASWDSSMMDDLSFLVQSSTCRVHVLLLRLFVSCLAAPNLNHRMDHSASGEALEYPSEVRATLQQLHNLAEQYRWHERYLGNAFVIPHHVRSTRRPAEPEPADRSAPDDGDAQETWKSKVRPVFYSPFDLLEEVDGMGCGIQGASHSSAAATGPRPSRSFFQHYVPSAYQNMGLAPKEKGAVRGAEAELPPPARRSALQSVERTRAVARWCRTACRAPRDPSGALAASQLPPQARDVAAANAERREPPPFSALLHQLVAILEEWIALLQDPASCLAYARRQTPVGVDQHHCSNSSGSVHLLAAADAVLLELDRVLGALGLRHRNVLILAHRIKQRLTSRVGWSPDACGAAAEPCSGP